MPPRVHGDLVAETGKATLVLGNEQGFEAALTVPWDVDARRPILGQHGFVGRAIAVVDDLAGFLGAGRVT